MIVSAEFSTHPREKADQAIESPPIAFPDASIEPSTSTQEQHAHTSSQARDNLLVSWDDDDDPSNPYNWPTWRKAVNGSLLSLLALITPLASSFFAPGVPDIMREFSSDSDLLAVFVVFIHILGFVFGKVVLALSCSLSDTASVRPSGHCPDV